MDRTFLFYDIETSGLNKSFDQVLEFAAIRTDERLRPIETYEILVKVSADTLIDPDALLIHQLSIDVCEQGVPEHEAILEIHQCMNTPGTISVGYNTLGFDDEFLRFSFFRHLLTPYTHQYANGCGRADIYPMVILYHLFRPNQLQWPQVEGRYSMKLEDLSIANDCVSGRAHTALADVQATLALAQKLYQDEGMFQYALGYFNKRGSEQRLAQLPAVKQCKAGRVGLYIDGRLGRQVRYQAPVWVLGTHQVYRNQSILLRLDRFSPERLAADGIEGIEDWMIRKKHGESGFLVPLNRGDSFRSVDDQTKLHNTLNWFCEHEARISQIAEHYCTQVYSPVPECDPAACLYQIGFPTHETIRLYAHFWTLPLDQQVDYISALPPHAQSCAQRLIWRQAPAYFESAPSAQLDLHLARVQGLQSPSVDYRGKPMRTVAQVRTRIDQLISEVSAEQKSGLLAYQAILAQRWPE